MSANVEQMAYTGEVPWHGLGNYVGHAMSSEEALRLGPGDWKVISTPVHVNGKEVPNYKANVRSSDGKVFGVVSDRYKIVQNSDAFAFTDFLLKNDLGIKVTYETAGALDGGKRVWILANLPPELVLGDKIIPYLVFTNSHDGKGSIRIAVTPTRVVCQNTLNLALSTASRTWSTRHIGDMDMKIKEAENTLLRTRAYMEGLNTQAETLQQTKVTSAIVKDFMAQIFPLEKMASARQTANVDMQRGLVLDLYSNKPDLQIFKGTAWGLYNALADFESHSSPLRTSLTFKENRFTSLVDGNARLEEAERFLLAV